MTSFVLRDWLTKVNEPFYMPLDKIVLAYDVEGSLVIHGSSHEDINVNVIEPNWRIVTPAILAAEYDFDNPKSISYAPYAFFYTQDVTVNDKGRYVYPEWGGPCWYLMPV